MDLSMYRFRRQFLQLGITLYKQSPVVLQMSVDVNMNADQTINTQTEVILCKYIQVT